MVEHSLGKGEVDSSILSGSTRSNFPSKRLLVLQAVTQPKGSVVQRPRVLQRHLCERRSPGIALRRPPQARHGPARTGRAKAWGPGSSGSTMYGRRCWRRQCRRHEASLQTPRGCSDCWSNARLRNYGDARKHGSRQHRRADGPASIEGRFRSLARHHFVAARIGHETPVRVTSHFEDGFK